MPTLTIAGLSQLGGAKLLPSHIFFTICLNVGTNSPRTGIGMKLRQFPRTLLASLALVSVSFAFAEQPPASTPVKLGASPFLFQTVPDWGILPKDISLSPTHGGIAVDHAGNVYVSGDGAAGIIVLSPNGTLLRTMAPECAGTVSLWVHGENGKEFLYGAHLRGRRAFKMSLDGKTVLSLPFPAEAGIYSENGLEFKPSAITVAADGSIFVADGYGTSYIHKYDSSGKYLGSFGGKGQENGQILNCQGLAIDNRYGQPLLLVCDCDNRRLQHFDLNGNFVDAFGVGLRRPVAVSVSGQFVAVAELEGRVTILDQKGDEVVHLGDNPDHAQWANFAVPAARWQSGVFMAPQGVAWDTAGDLYIQEWNLNARLTKLVPSH